MAETFVQRYHAHDFRLRGTAGGANPFLVELSATFTHESGETIAGLPGFYDGDDTWVIRFSPTREGVWRGLTASGDPALNGIALGPLTCRPNDNPRVHGRLGIDAAHPRRFAFDDGTPLVPLGFECDWLFALHQARPDACRAGADLIASRGFNYIVTNVYAHTGFSDPENEWVFSPPQMYVFGGSNDAPDHSRLNIDFFRDFDQLMAHLHQRGVVAHLMIQVQNKKVAWPARRSAQDDLYWRYVVARYQAYGNLVWDVSKESYNLLRETGSHDYTIDRISLIRRTDAYHHLVTAHDTLTDSAAQDSPADDACDFVSDQIHLRDVGLLNHEASRRFRRGSKPYMNIEYGYEEGAEPIKTYHSESTRPWQDVLLWTYAIYLGGGYPCYYYNNTSWDLVKFEPEPAGWQRYGFLMDLLKQFDLNAMTPDNDFVTRGFCLAEAGRQYLVFLPEGGDTHIDLTAVPASSALSCEWMDIYSGERKCTPADKRGFSTRLKNPLADASHPCVVAIRPEVHGASHAADCSQTTALSF